MAFGRFGYVKDWRSVSAQMLLSDAADFSALCVTIYAASGCPTNIVQLGRCCLVSTKRALCSQRTHTRGLLTSPDNRPTTSTCSASEDVSRQRTCSLSGMRVDERAANKPMQCRASNVLGHLVRD